VKMISLLGSTGSIGTQALDVIAAYPDKFSVRALAAKRQVKQLAEQARRFKPSVVAIADESCYNELKAELSGLNIIILTGAESLCELASDQGADMVFNALVGFAGLAPTLAALEAKKELALANKESLVAGGHLVMSLAARNETAVLPVDSEHSAIFQCMQGQQVNAIDRIILTASGGPFFGKGHGELMRVKPADALKHPNWDMGAKITIDSATMMNKGLEVIEARWLFDMPYEKIDVVVHRESIIHSMVEFSDGAVLAQMGVPDMRVPIQYALTYPERLVGNAPRVRWDSLGRLHFAEPDRVHFPCLSLAYQAGLAGGSMPCVLNAANEAAVGLFLSGEVGFLSIPSIIESVMNKHKVVYAPEYGHLVEIDRDARLDALACAKLERVKRC
jgi:1-deoxy-D-xylulose-5-phosphate reductoisomerase